MDQRPARFSTSDILSALRQRQAQQANVDNARARRSGPDHPAFEQTTWDSYRKVDSQLERLCARPTLGENGTVRPDIIRQVRLLLHAQDQRAHRSGDQCWQMRPRIYCILRRINAIHLMNKFVAHKLNDFYLPFAEHTLPDFVTSDGAYNFREMFLETQVLYLTQMKDVETPEGRHLLLYGSGDVLFEYHQHLGRGGFGEVDKVQSRLSYKMYARKRVLRGRDSGRNRAAQSSLVEELQQLRRLQHEHLVKILGSYTDDEYIAFIMTPIADYNLGHLLTRRKPLTNTESDMLRQFYGCLAGAVGFLHDNSIRHRDLTRRNILVYQGKVYISDFGSAYSYANRTTSNTRHHQQPVSPDYMSPEMAKNEERGSSSDMWSLGVVFLEMATRLRGHKLDDLELAIHHHAKSKRRPPYLCYNTPVINTWLSTLRKSDGYGMNNHDKEPLEWIANLLAENPKRRPTAKILMKDILESLSFNKFCCIKCEGFFWNSGFEYDSVMRQTTEVRNAREIMNEVSGVFDSQKFSTKFDGGQSEDRHNSIAQWAGAVQEDLRETKESVPFTEETVYSNFYPVPTIHEDIGEDFNDNFEEDTRHTQPQSTRIPEAQAPIEEKVDNNAAQNSQTARTPQTAQIPGYWPGQLQDKTPSVHPDISDEKIQANLINDTLHATQEYDDEDDRLFDEISDADSLASAVSEASKAGNDAEEDEDALFNEVSSDEDEEGKSKERVPQSDNGSQTKDRKVGENISYQDDTIESKQATVEDAPEAEHNAESSSNHIQQGNMGQTLSRQIENTINDAQPEIVITRATFGAASGKVGPEIVIDEANFGATQDVEPEIVITRASFGSACNDAETQTPITRASFGVPWVDFEQPKTPVEAAQNDQPKVQKPKKVQFEPVIEPIPEPFPGNFATQATSQEPRSAPLSNANLRMHNRSRSTSTLADTLKPSSFIQDTWESASSAPTSVITASTRERIEKSLLPFQRLDGTFKILSQQCRLGNHKEVRVLLSHGCNPGTKKKPYSSPIFSAARGGTDQHFKCARALVGAEANVNVVKSDNGKTPLHYAVEHEPYPKYEKLIWLFINAGARVNVADTSGEYPLMKLFVGNDSSPLQKHRLRAMAILLKAGAKVNISAPVTGNTPLHLAVRRQDPWAVAMLLHMGASVATANNTGATALQITANQFRGELAPNHEQILELLLEAEKERASQQGFSMIDFKAGVYERTALHLAMYSETIDAANMLLEYGADLDVVDTTDKTPRIIAREKGFKIEDGRIIV